jgi:[protein-PII] uridylyltransferase
MQDEIIRILFEFAGSELYPHAVPSEAEHMAVIATGGYGRGLLAPGSDIDLLFLLPYKQTAWGESVAEALLYCLWDMGLKVGHATRSVSECIRQAKADMTIRTAMLESRYLFGDAETLQRADDALRQGNGAGHGAGIRRRQARRARGAPSPRRPVALSGRAQRQGRQGRACATCTRCSGSPNMFIACASPRN